MRDSVRKMTLHFKCPIIWNRVRITMSSCLYNVAENLQTMKLAFQNCMLLGSTKPHKHMGKKASLNIVDSRPNSWKTPRFQHQALQSRQLSDCSSLEKKSPHFFLTHLFCFIFFLQTCRAVICDWKHPTERNSLHLPSLRRPTHSASPSNQIFHYPSCLFLFIFSVTHDLFLFA